MLWVYDGSLNSVKFAVPAVAPPAGYLVIMQTGDEVSVYAHQDPAGHIDKWMSRSRRPMSALRPINRVAIALVEEGINEILRDVLFLLAPCRIYLDSNYYYTDVDHVRSIVMDVLQQRDMNRSRQFFGDPVIHAIQASR